MKKEKPVPESTGPSFELTGAQYNELMNLLNWAPYFREIQPNARDFADRCTALKNSIVAGSKPAALKSV